MKDVLALRVTFSAANTAGTHTCTWHTDAHAHTHAHVQVKDVLALRVTFSAASTAGEMLMSAMGKPLSDAEVDALLCHGVYRQVLHACMRACIDTGVHVSHVYRRRSMRSSAMAEYGQVPQPVPPVPPVPPIPWYPTPCTPVPM